MRSDSLRFILFGAPRIERNGEPAPLRRSKGLALLAYLAVTGAPQSRDSLLALFWPNFDSASARNNLRRELSLARMALGEEIISADRQRIAWNASNNTFVDVVAFQEQASIARQHHHANGILCDSCAQALGEAERLAAAEFMAGFGLDDSPAFEEWLLFKREELHQQLDWTLHALTTWHDHHGDHQAALALAGARPAA